MSKPTITPTTKKIVTVGNPSGEKGEAIARDLVERLRDLAKYSPVDMTADDCLEAADEIESLQEQAAVAELAVLKLQDEIERLRKDRDYWYMRYGEVGRGGARNAALEEAAVRLDREGTSLVDASEIAAVIRALKEGK